MSTSMAASVISANDGVDACWSRIGVRGDKSCPQLRQHIHCRNCPTYGAVGAAILDARSADTDCTAFSGASASPAAPRAEQVLSVMTFRLGAESFGLPVRSCREVIEARAIHSLPRRRHEAVLGLANVRGALLICVSLHILLHSSQSSGSSDSTDKNSRPRLLVMESGTGPLAVPVDEVWGVVRYELRDLRPVPAVLAKSQQVHTQRVLVAGQRTIGLLDVDLLWRTLADILA